MKTYRWPAPVAGYLFALVFLGAALFASHFDLLPRVAPVAGLGAALCAFLFSRGLAIMLLAAYVGGALVLDWDWQQAFDPETVFHTAIFVVANIGIILIMSRLRHTLESARRTERNRRLIADNTTELILAYAMDRKLIYVNPGVERLIGYTPEELRGSDFIPWVHPSDQRRMDELTEKLDAGGSFADIEFRVLTRDGQVRWFSATRGPLRDERGRQIGIQSAFKALNATSPNGSGCCRSSIRISSSYRVPVTRPKKRASGRKSMPWNWCASTKSCCRRATRRWKRPRRRASSWLR
ncbi:MAG: PAS domain S-box protein [Acidobacteria bacterium]|nr:PAS domain S-box protein [Acidobacteriota bacterium]